MPAAGARSAEGGFRALSGRGARAFTVPPDMQLVRTLPLPNGGEYRRFQQMSGSARVLGGQLSLFTDAAGTVKTVIGAHYPTITRRNSVAITRAAAARAAARDVGPAEDRSVVLRIDPVSGLYFYEVESRSLAERWIHWIDAATGRTLRRIDAVEETHGTGVKRDAKDMNGPDNSATADDLTRYHSRAGHGNSRVHWDLVSKDGRQRTFDARNSNNELFYVTDRDNHWTLVTSNRRSPGQPALVDAQYYANKTDDYYLRRLGLNWKDCGYPRMESAAHVGVDIVNAAWTGDLVIFGDGDGVIAREFSGALDIVAHEFGHGVTGCTSALIYAGESGALNESFSDVLGTGAEWFTKEPLRSNCKLAANQSSCRDWWIGEDIWLEADTVPGLRNLADPAEDGQPDHYSELVNDPNDNGGVHTNMGIPNHAYYLLVNGGQNAGCDATGSNGHTHTANCDVTVTGIGLKDAEQIFFSAFIALPENATMCEARAATQAEAVSAFGASSTQAQATAAAWGAVGVASAC